MSKIKIKTPEGEGIIDTKDISMPAIQITDLGYVQIRVYYPKKSIWIKYNICTIENLLEKSSEIKI
jgi:hypothetical protein